MRFSLFSILPRRPTQFQQYNIHNFHNLVNHPSFSHNRNTVMFHYGLSQAPGTPAVAEMTEAYVSAGNVNYVLVNYASIATNVSPVSFGAYTLAK